MAAPKIPRIEGTYCGGKSVDVSSVDATFDPPIQAFMVSATGNVKVTFADGAPVGAEVMVYTGCVVGTIYKGNIQRIWATGTTGTAANVMVLY